jgi:hypothetical protein
MASAQDVISSQSEASNNSAQGVIYNQSETPANSAQGVMYGHTPPANSAQGVMYGHTPPANSAQGVMYGQASDSHHNEEYNEVATAEYNDLPEGSNQIEVLNEKVPQPWSTRRIVL